MELAVPVQTCKGVDYGNNAVKKDIITIYRKNAGTIRFCNPARVRAPDSCIPKTDLIRNTYGQPGRTE
jgi:hypothetical protein